MDMHGKNLVLLNKYRIFELGFLGCGAYAEVYQGYDIKTNEPVAVKINLSGRGIFKNMKVNHEVDHKTIQKKFRRQVDVLASMKGEQRINRPPRTDATGVVRIEPPVDLILDDLFVQLRDYSRNKRGLPGLAPGIKAYFVVLDLACYTLEDYVSDRVKKRDPLSSSEIRALGLEIIHMCSALEQVGLVHMDIKPANIMRGADGKWKLIDVDGVMRAGNIMSATDNSTNFTATYASPEIANWFLGDFDMMLDVRMDSWSMGLVLLDLVLGRFYLERVYLAMRKKPDGVEEFFQFIGDEDTPLWLPEKIEELDPLLDSLVRENLLVKKLEERYSAIECMSHPFYDACKKCSNPNPPAISPPHFLENVAEGLAEKVNEADQKIIEKSSSSSSPLMNKDVNVTKETVVRRRSSAGSSNLSMSSLQPCKVVLQEEKPGGEEEPPPALKEAPIIPQKRSKSLVLRGEVAVSSGAMQRESGERLLARMSTSKDVTVQGAQARKEKRSKTAGAGEGLQLLKGDMLKQLEELMTMHQQIKEQAKNTTDEGFGRTHFDRKRIELYDFVVESSHKVRITASERAAPPEGTDKAAPAPPPTRKGKSRIGVLRSAARRKPITKTTFSLCGRGEGGGCLLQMSNNVRKSKRIFLCLLQYAE